MQQPNVLAARFACLCPQQYCSPRCLPAQGLLSSGRARSISLPPTFFNSSRSIHTVSVASSYLIRSGVVLRFVSSCFFLAWMCEVAWMLLSMPVFSPAISPCLPSSSLPTGTFPVHATATLASLNSSTHLPQRLNASTASRSNDSTLTSTPPHHFFFQRLNVSSSSWSSSQHSGQLPDRQCTRAHAPLTTSLLTTCFSPLHYSLLTTHYLLLTILSTHYSLLLPTSYF